MNAAAPAVQHVDRSSFAELEKSHFDCFPGGVLESPRLSVSMFHSDLSDPDSGGQISSQKSSVKLTGALAGSLIQSLD